MYFLYKSILDKEIIYLPSVAVEVDVGVAANLFHALDDLGAS
jgi:hypothetical protein